MKIAFISYEYPPDTAFGGIATYVYQAARLLKNGGHHVEVFAGSLERSGTETEDGIIVHRVLESDRQKFPEVITQVFAERHPTVQFDVVEGPELYAEARKIIQRFPDLPLVVKLHTPMFLIKQINDQQYPFTTKFRFYLRDVIKRGANPISYWYYQPHHDVECLHTLEADEVVLLTQGMADKVVKTWKLDTHKLSYIPNPYIPSEKLLNIRVDTQTNRVTFMGRLEYRKGVIDFAQSIHLILKNHPSTKFRFVGSPGYSPNRKLNMRQYLEQYLQAFQKSIEFVNPVPLAEIPRILAETDICVFPSLWENFPNVCLEAMAAARGVVGSHAGGMTEMLNHGKVGRLVPPHSSDKIAHAVNELLQQPELRMQLGQAARDRLLAEYSPDQIRPLLEASYQRAITRRQAKGARKGLAK